MKRSALISSFESDKVSYILIAIIRRKTVLLLYMYMNLNHNNHRMVFTILASFQHNNYHKLHVSCMLSFEMACVTLSVCNFVYNTHNSLFPLAKGYM